MEPDRLPPELEELERQLSARLLRDPPPELRQRTLGRIEAELLGDVAQNNESRDEVRGRWAFATAVAVSVLVWINFSLCATSATNCRLGLEANRERVSRTTAQINQLLPELDVREASRQALLLEAGSRLALCPEMPTAESAAVRADHFAIVSP